MSKFDLIFEKALLSLREEEQYVESTFTDNLTALLKILNDNDLLARDANLETELQKLKNQPKNTKEIVLDLKENGMPPIKIQAHQESDSESFAVTVINLENPEEQKQFANSMLETIFDDAISYIRTITMQGMSPEAAIDELPPTEGADSQPGADQTALPR